LRFYTEKECEEWLSDRKRQKPDRNSEINKERFDYPSKPHEFFWAAHWIASSLPHYAPALLWITEWGIWENTQTSHLYYKLRQSYGDQQLLWDAPGHLFLGYEMEDLASFLQVAMLNGWGGYLLTDLNYINAFFSHDEFVEFFAEEECNLYPVRRELLSRDAR